MLVFFEWCTQHTRNGTAVTHLCFPSFPPSFSPSDGNLEKDRQHVSAFISLDRPDDLVRPLGWETFLHMRFYAVNEDPSKTMTNCASMRL